MTDRPTFSRSSRRCADDVAHIQIGLARVGHLAAGVGTSGSADRCGCDTSITFANLRAEQATGNGPCGLAHTRVNARSGTARVRTGRVVARMARIFTFIVATLLVAAG